jgi:hypothetical protein
MSAEKIRIIYANNKKSGNSDLLTPILFIGLVISVFSYYYKSIQQKLLNTSWEEKKCSPRYLFFSGFLNPLDKNPWHTTQSNFQKCVANNMYKDPDLSRDIKTNKYYIQKNDDEIQKNLVKSKKITSDIRKQWNTVLEAKQGNLTDIHIGNTGIFENQGSMYSNVAQNSNQLFQVLKSILYYLKNTLIFKANYFKKQLSIDKKHDDFMTEYRLIYNNFYIPAFENLNQEKLTSAMNSARDAVDKYNELTKKLDLYIEKSLPIVAPITETCYKLRYSVHDSTCNQLFPNLNEIPIDLFPNIRPIIS